MVTLGTDVSWNYNLVSALLNKGMTCARINCAHDDTKVWGGKMIENVRRAISETGMPCPILMDLAGHKIRTGPVALEPPIYHIKVKKRSLRKSRGFWIFDLNCRSSKHFH